MHCQVAESTSLSLLNSNVQHTILECSVHAMFVDGYCNHVNLINTRMRLANLYSGISLTCLTSIHENTCHSVINDCQV